MKRVGEIKHTCVIKDIHNSWLCCFTNHLELGTHVSLSHRQMFHQEASVETIKKILACNENSNMALKILQNHIHNVQKELYREHIKENEFKSKSSTWDYTSTVV